MPRVDAASEIESKSADKEDNGEEHPEQEETKKKKKKQNIGFRDRKVSTPDLKSTGF